MNSFKTEKGTEIPIGQIKGKDYLEVKWRLVWFREERETWSIQTEFISHTDDAAFAKATIRDESGNIMATAHKYEDVRGFGDFREKAETGAIGRALALVGYGTQFAPELEEGDKRIVDAPIERNKKVIEKHFGPQPPENPSDYEAHERAAVAMEAQAQTPLGEYVVPLGQYSKGKMLKEMRPEDIIGPAEYLQADAEKPGNS